MLVEWGLQKADELGIDAFVEATDDGRPLYTAKGFGYVKTIFLNTAKKDPSEEWIGLEQRMGTPAHCLLMWRPKGGSDADGETKA